MQTKKLQIVGGLGSSVEVDATLTQSGQAADAKAVGDAINNKLSNTGWAANSFLTTDENGSVVAVAIDEANEVAW